LFVLVEYVYFPISGGGGGIFSWITDTMSEDQKGKILIIQISSYYYIENLLQSEEYFIFFTVQRISNPPCMLKYSLCNYNLYLKAFTSIISLYVEGSRKFLGTLQENKLSSPPDHQRKGGGVGIIS
jgi:hypothetical protein